MVAKGNQDRWGTLRQEMEERCVKMMEELTRAFVDQARKRKFTKESLSFSTFRDLWQGNGPEGDVTILHPPAGGVDISRLVGEASNTREACQIVQELFAAAVRGLKSESRLGVTDEEKMQQLAQQVAAIYASYAIYILQPITPKVCIYLPQAYAEELLLLLMDCRDKVGCFDCHAIAQRLGQEEAFIYGSFRKEDKGQRQIAASRKKMSHSGLTFASWKDTKVAENIAKSCLKNIDFDRDLLRRYNEDLRKMTRNENMCSSLLENVDTWNKTLEGKIKDLLGDVTRKSQADWHDRYEEVFGKRKLYESQTVASSSSRAVAGGGITTQARELGQESWEDLLKGLPPQWRKKIRKVLESKKKKKIDKVSLINMYKTKHKLMEDQKKSGGTSTKGGALPPRTTTVDPNDNENEQHASVSVPPSSEAKNQDVEEDDDYDADGFAKLLEQELEA
jgi:hypothetical protein